MFKVLFTLDYEIHGNGDGDSYKMMVEPTRRLMKFLENYGAKLTIFADVAEILKFKEFYINFGKDNYYCRAIEDQLKNAIYRGHDVQLHIHSSYFNSYFHNGKWVQDYDEFNLASLSYDKILQYVQISKEYLESLLKPINNNYSCIAFRAAGWSMAPSENIINALLKNGIYIDSSVWRNGIYNNSLINFNYTNSHHSLLPWFVNEKDICVLDRNGSFLEIPIYCEDKRIWEFLTPSRIYRSIRSQLHKQPTVPMKNNTEKEISKHTKHRNKFSKIMRNRYPLKLDINYPLGFQLIKTVSNLGKQYHGKYKEIPLVVSGHSKSFTKMNKYYVQSFLKYLSENKDTYQFAKYKDIDIEYFRTIKYEM